MTEVVGIGSALFDILMTADRFPEEDTKLQGKDTKIQCGGPCATALVAMSKLGILAEYMGTLGDDMYGSFIRGEFKKYGVECGNVRSVEGTQSFHSFVLLNLANTSRTCIWSRGTVPAPVESDVDLNVLKGAKYLHLDGHQLDTAIYAARKAHEFGVKVSHDAGGTYPGIERLLPYDDVLIPSEEFALKITESSDAVEAAGKLAERFAPEVLIITQGSRGGFLWQDGREVRYPVFPVSAVDSNGAGDTFHGAFIAARIKGMDVYDAACFASACSALKCTRFGAQEGIPHFDEVEEFMKNNRGVIRNGRA